MNINRDYLIINNVKKSSITLNNGSMFFYITDKNTQNIFVNLVINISDNELIQKYANIENAEDYTLTMNIVKPDNDCKIIEGRLCDKEKAIFEFNLKEDCVDKVGTYKCELLTKCNINGHEEITTSNSLTYTVNSSILNDLDGIVEAPEYPAVIQLFDRLSEFEQYEEDRRANELARQLAEQQRQTRIDTLIVDTKADIDEYKATKDIEINNAITAQDNKINAQNNRLDIVENKNTQQDNRLDIVEAKNTEQDNRLTTIEAIDVAQNSRLDAIEAKNQQQDDRLLAIEKVNERQDADLEILLGEPSNNMTEITKKGNSIYLQNSVVGHCEIDNIQGNTLVNCNKEPNKQLILNGNINTSAASSVTLTEGVNGGKVDVALEGNTLVNVSKTKDITALPLEEELTYLYASTQYTVQFVSDAAITVDITLGGTQLLAQSIVVGLNRISITTPATLVDNKLVISGVGANVSEVVVVDTGRNFGYFEGMKSVGEGGNLVITSSNSDNTLLNTQQLTHEPLRAVGDVKDKYVLIDGKWYIERNCTYNGMAKYNVLNITNLKGVAVTFTNRKKNSHVICDSIKLGNSSMPGTFYLNPGNLVVVFDKNDPITDEDMIAKVSQYNFIYQLATPVYEEIDYNPFEVYSGITHITTNSTIPANITVKNHGFNCLLKPSTTYTISSNLGLNIVTTPSTLTEDCLRFMDTDTSDVTTMRDVLVLEGDWTTKADLIPANFSGIESAFEQEYDAEKGKYKVNIKVANENKNQENNITFYINEPLRGIGSVKDKIYVKDNKVVVERKYGVREYQNGDFGTYPTDKVNTVYPLAESVYEEVEYNGVKMSIETFENSTLSYNSNVPVTSTVRYSYSVPIVDTVAQTANVTDQQDSMIIDLATQVAVMEMMLM